MSYSYEYNILDTITDDVMPSKLKEEVEASSITATILDVQKFGSTIKVIFSASLTSEEKTTLDSLVASHEHITTAESLKEYLDHQVFPFIENLINNFAAENIAMGITQAGKTADILSLFEKKYDIGAANPVSLKTALDTGSLYVAKDIMQHIRDNPVEYTGMDPFITDTRLLKLKNKIESFLGLALTL